MEHVSDILKLSEHKGHECIDERSFAYDALKLMSTRGIRCILVFKNGRLTGLFSEGCHARNVLVKGLSSWKSLMSGIMRTDYCTVSPDTTVVECKELFKGNIGHYLPVMKDNKVVGVISVEDVDNSIIRDQSAEIELLKDYVYCRHS